MPRKIFVSELQSVLLTRDFVHVSSLEMVHSQLSAGGPLELRKGEYLKWSQLLKPLWHLRYFQAICTFGGPVFFFLFGCFFPLFGSNFSWKRLAYASWLAGNTTLLHQLMLPFYTLLHMDLFHSCTEIYNSDGGLPSLCLDRELWNHLQGVVEWFAAKAGTPSKILNHSVTFANSILPRVIFLWFDWQSSNSSIHLFGVSTRLFAGDVPHTQPAKVCLVGQHGCDFVDLWPCQGNSMQQLSALSVDESCWPPRWMFPKMDVWRYLQL